MKTLYALIFACLSLQACIGQSETTPTAATKANESTAAVSIVDDDDFTGVVFSPANKPIEDTSIDLDADDHAYFLYGQKSDSTCPDDEHTATVPAVKPLEDYSIDPSIDYDDYTGGVTSPASKTFEDIDNNVDVNLDDDGWDFKLPETIDSVQPSDWY